MGTLQFGAWQAVVNCVKLKPGERVVIITDIAAKKISEAIQSEAEKISHGNITTFIMENYGERPDNPSDKIPALAFADEIRRALESAQVSFYVAAGKKGELQTFRSPMLRTIESNRYLRHAHLPGITMALMETGMSVDYAKVQALSAKVYEICHKARQIQVTNPAGTNFTAYFNPQWKWIISDANISKDGVWSNLPDGEVFTCAEHVSDGQIVVDGILGDFFSEKYGLLNKTPVTIQLKDSRVAHIASEHKTLLAEFQERLCLDENANRVAEFAIGTNIGLTSLIGNLLQDEKFPGVHVAFGHGYPEKTGSNWSSNGHIDAVLTKVTVVVDGQKIIEDGKFLI